VSKVEYSRHQAWRVGGVMNFLQERLEWGTSPAEIATLLRSAAATLERTARLVTEEEDDILEWVEHRKQPRLR
jgi:hypothetical protein